MLGFIWFTLKIRGAVIWRIDKYLPSAAVKVSAIMKEKVSFSLMETGPLMGWSENGGARWMAFLLSRLVKICISLNCRLVDLRRS